MQPHRDMRQAPGVGGASPSHACAPESVRMCARSADPDVGGHRHERHAGDQAAGHGQHRRGGRGGQHRHPLRAADPLGHRGRRADEVAAGQHGAVDAHGVADVGSGGDGGRIQRGQQHASEATRDTWRWMRSSASRRARCTATTG